MKALIITTEYVQASIVMEPHAVIDGATSVIISQDEPGAEWKEYRTFPKLEQAETAFRELSSAALALYG